MTDYIKNSPRVPFSMKIYVKLVHRIKILEKKIQQTSTKSNPIRIQKSKYHLSLITNL